MNEDELSKLRSQPLRDAARGKSPERVSVLVEIDMPMPRVELGPKSAAGAPRPRGFKTGPGEDNARRERAAALLKSVLGEVPRYSRSAAAFFVEATGEQLSAIAASPDVKAIHPNRDLK